MERIFIPGCPNSTGFHDQAVGDSGPCSPVEDSGGAVFPGTYFESGQELAQWKYLERDVLRLNRSTGLGLGGRVLPEDKLGLVRELGERVKLATIRIFENEVQKNSGLAPFAGFAGFGAIR